MVLERRDPLVITRPYYLDSYDCGYCQCKKPVSAEAQTYPPDAKVPRTPTHVTIGCKVEQMTCGDYDEFMNLGFRRSGDFLYKGDMLRGCCRMYTIRTQLAQMTVSKEHRQVVNRFKRAIGDRATDDERAKNEGKGKHARNAHGARFVLSSLIGAEKASKRFYTRFEPAKFSEAKFALYKRYQTVVHNDKPEDVTKSSFTNFLCHSPFLDREIDGTGAEWDELNAWVSQWEEKEKDERAENDEKARKVRRLGPTHECYYLDGTLIAISVLDFLPTGVSSVYLIWDPDYAHLSLGTLSGIREVQMCHELNLGYYYLGYYIEDCEKMRYKKKFGGEVLDVCNETFVSLEAVRPMMQNDDFWALSENGHEVDESTCSSEDPDEGESLQKEGKSEENGTEKNESSDDDADESDGEHELALTGHPGSWNDNLVNVARKIYGSAETYKTAETSQKILEAELGYTRPELPSVLPGAIPLCQLVSWMEEDALDRELPVTVYSARTGRLHECDLGDLGPGEQSHVIDFLRLFGLERTQEAIIIA